jgi:hypothetical protein
MVLFPDPNLTTAEVIEALYASGKTVQEWGRAIDGTPILSASMGTGKTPAILVTAGVHASESAGTHAALKLLTELQTDYEVNILPLRDPFGFAGVNHCLSFAANLPVMLTNHIETLEYLKQSATLLYAENDLYIYKMGDIGFIWTPCRQDSFYRTIERIGELNSRSPKVLQPLWGKSLMLLSPDMGCEGSAEMQRCWHGVFSQQGEWLNLNRFFGRSNTPPEVAALSRLIQTVHPALICDLQEDRVSGFWLGVPRSKNASDNLYQTARAFIGTLREIDAPILSYKDMVAINHPDTVIPGLLEPETRLPGMTWMDILPRGEVHNLLTYAATLTAGFGVEAPMKQPLALRVDGITRGMLAAIREWEAQEDRNEYTRGIEELAVNGAGDKKGNYPGSLDGSRQNLFFE